jgi:hypothetical protein
MIFVGFVITACWESLLYEDDIPGAIPDKPE